MSIFGPLSITSLLASNIPWQWLVVLFICCFIAYCFRQHCEVQKIKKISHAKEGNKEEITATGYSAKEFGLIKNSDRKSRNSKKPDVKER